MIEQVNGINMKITQLFLDAAKESNMTKTLSSGKCRTNPKKKPWFNKECMQARGEYHRKKNLYRKFPNNFYMAQLRTASKTYKRTVLAAKAEHQRKIAAELEELESGEPDAFWDILNRETNFKTHSPIQPTIDSFHFHFSNLYKKMPDDSYRKINDDQIPNNNYLLNEDITLEQVIQAMKKLKNGKSPGLDNILNEFLKYSPYVVKEIITKFFNIIFKTSIIPDKWNVACIIPVYKNRGSRVDPNNYRGISLLSCLGKLFTSVLNIRLTQYLDTYDVLGSEQAGFRAGHSTTDHIFNLRTLINLYI